MKDQEVNKSISKWKYMGYDNFTDVCADFCHILDRIHYYSDFRADGLRSALKFGTINKIRMFTSWMGTKMTYGIFERNAEDLLALTREQINDCRQADMIRMMGKQAHHHHLLHP